MQFESTQFRSRLQTRFSHLQFPSLLLAFEPPWCFPYLHTTLCFYTTPQKCIRSPQSEMAAVEPEFTYESITATSITPRWLNTVLGIGSITAIEVEQIGADIGLTDLLYRIHLTHSSPLSSSVSIQVLPNQLAPTRSLSPTQPASLILKVLDSSLPHRQAFSALSLQEILFYTRIAPLVDLETVPKCYFSAFNEEARKGCLLLQDAGQSVHGGHLPVATAVQGIKAMAEVGRFHGRGIRVIASADAQELKLESLERPLQATLSEIRAALPSFASTWRPYVGDDIVARFESAINVYERQWLPLQDSFLRGLVHGDYRIGNVVFGKPPQKKLIKGDSPLSFVDDMRRSISRRHDGGDGPTTTNEDRGGSENSGSSTSLEEPVNVTNGASRLDQSETKDEDLNFHIVDWATLSYGPVLQDVAYFLAIALSVPDRRAHEDELLRAWYDSLKEAAGDDMPANYDMGRAKEELRWCFVKAVLIVVTTTNHMKAPKPAMQMLGAKLRDVSEVLVDWKAVE